MWIRDKVDLSVYLGQLADLWARDGKRFGLPKDWDTIAIVYNKDALAAAGVTEEELNSATWNPEDGGTFGETHRQADRGRERQQRPEPGLRQDQGQAVRLRDHGNSAGEAYGQTEWSWLTNTTGWKYNDDLYDTKYYYDDPRFIATIQWIADMMQKGLIMPFEQVTEPRRLGGLQQRPGALACQRLLDDRRVRQERDHSRSASPACPQGPEGRKSMFNGLADSIWVGTKHPDQAWEWVKYLASQECADIVGEAGVVFPAQQSAVDKALAAYKAKGLDVSAFTEQALDPNGTFLFPVTDNASEITTIMSPAMQSILLGQTDAQTALTKANQEVNALFK